MSKTKAITPASDERSQDAEKRVADLIQRANRGDKAALAQLRDAYNERPTLWLGLGNMARHAEAAWIAATAGDNELLREAIERKLTALREELAGPTPTRLESLLVTRITACWLALQYAEASYAQRMKDLSIPWADYYQRRIDGCHRRYLSAIKALALVRRLALPAVQVNIAERQVNQVNTAQVADDGR